VRGSGRIVSHLGDDPGDVISDLRPVAQGDEKIGRVSLGQKVTHVLQPRFEFAFPGEQDNLVGVAPDILRAQADRLRRAAGDILPGVRPLGEITCDVEDFGVRTSAFRLCRIMPSMRPKSWRWSGLATADARNTGTLPKAQKAT